MINKVILVGNLGKDPEVRHFEGNSAVASFSVATSESYIDKATQERTTKTEWHNVTMWNGLATVAEKYLKKGSQVYIEGKLSTRKWQDKEGRDQYTTEIVARTMKMLGGKSGGSYSAPAAPVQVAQAATTPAPVASEPAKATPPAAEVVTPTEKVAAPVENTAATPAPENDDLPF